MPGCSRRAASIRHACALPPGEVVIKRGAEPTLLYGPDDQPQVVLTESHRCSPAVAGAVAAVARRLPGVLVHAHEKNTGYGGNQKSCYRIALEQGLEREITLAEAQASHRREQKLRERLQQESKQLESANQQLNEAHDRLLLISRSDALTGISNRRHLVDELERAVHGFRRYGIDFSLVLLDVDHFKKINDTYGHQTGDLVLKGLAQQVSTALRDVDTFGRWGGEEFLCLLPNTTYEEAMECAERLRADLANARLVEAMPDFVVTASFGVVGCCGEDDADSVMSRVDAALYEAKAAGRNRVSGLSCFD